MSPEVERGKTAILAHVKKLMRIYSIDPAELVFRCEDNFDQAQWNLNICRGGKSRQLHFREEDVEALLASSSISVKDSASILHVIEMLKSA